MTSKPEAVGGLAGIVAGESDISTVGLGLGLNYRGYNIHDLAKNCIFEEVVHLLVYNVLPNEGQLAALRAKMVNLRTVPPILKNVLEALPGSSNAMDVMRTIASILGIIEPEGNYSHSLDKENDHYKIPLRLISVFGPALIYWYHFTKKKIRISTETSSSDTVALNFLKLYHQTDTIDPLIVRTFDVSLILYAEHDFNASTFAARCTVSTMSDFYSGITSAIGTLRGPLHGGANQAAMKLLEPMRSIEESNKMLQTKWKNKDLVMGFGHRIYKKEDPRSDIIKEYSIALSKTKHGKPLLVDISKNIESRMIAQKKIYPNLDFYAASAYHQCGIQTYLSHHIAISLRRYSSLRGLLVGLHISLSRGRPKKLSDPSRSTLDQSRGHFCQWVSDPNYDQLNKQFKMISDKRQKIVQFADNYVEAYFNDGSILSWSKGTICYFSSRGIRSTLNLSQVKQSADLTNKLNTIIDRQNRFNDEFFQSHIVSNTLEFIYKKYRIKEYRWDQGQVQIHKNEGYVVKSDDLNAEVELDMDLYTVRVTYLQLCSGKAVRNSQNHNFTATLLQKYNYKYVEFPQENKCEIEYEYLKQTKQFSIFNLPARWYAPIKKLWAYILVNKLVDYEFCHIDFDEQGIADQFVSSKMPPCVKISDWEQQCRQDLMPLAKYGHPSNNYKWKWFAVETPSGCVVAQAGEENIMSDGIGFWFVEVSTFIYKKKNQVPKDFSFYEQVIPLIIRFQDEVERDIKAELIAFLNYTRHNMTAGNNQMHPVETKIVSNELIASQVQGSGVFKAYANGMVIGKFTDKVILTMQGTDIKIISALGQSYFTTAGSEKQRGSVKDIYSQHIALVSDYYERIFYPEQWQHRMNLNQHLEEVIRSNKVSIAVCQLYKG